MKNDNFSSPQTSKNEEEQKLGRRIIARVFDNNQYQHMAGENTSRDSYLLPSVMHDLLANYTCDYVVVIPCMYSAPRAAYWFRNDGKVHSKFSQS
jgi:hypothetical protein